MESKRKKGARSASKGEEASRLLNAVEFLLSIPIGTQPAPPARPRDAAPGGVGREPEPAAARAGRGGGETLPPALGSSGVTVSVRLRGDRFRHITSRGARASPAFLTALLREGVHDGRMLFSANKEYPSATVSLIRYDPGAEATLAKERAAAATRLLLEHGVGAEGPGGGPRWRVGRSFEGLVRPGARRGVQEGRGRADAGGDGGGADLGYAARYDPLALDDPAFDRAGGRLSYERDGYAVSILGFRLTATAKADTNSRFAQAFPWLDFGPGASLTLSKVRSLKARALGLWWGRGWEVSTVALGIVAFERLVWLRLVTKANRKLAMAVALLLAFKHNEAAGESDAHVPPVADVVTSLEATFGVPRKVLIGAEFPVFVHLGFSLHAPPEHTLPHIDRLLSAKGSSLAEYMGGTWTEG